MPTLLALDTSTERLAIALRSQRGDSRIEEEGGARASTRIVPAALELLVAAGLRAGDLDAVAFGRGPGAFTGLRTACSVAQGLAFGAGCPVIALDSLMVVAEAVRLCHGVGDLWVVMDARMGEAYAAAYRRSGERWQVLAEPALYDIETLNERWRRDGMPAAMAGSGLEAFGDRLQAGDARRVEGVAERAEALLNLAASAWEDGDAVDAALALPIYLRDKVALTTVEREGLRR